MVGLENAIGQAFGFVFLKFHVDYSHNTSILLVRIGQNDLWGPLLSFHSMNLGLKQSESDGDSSAWDHWLHLGCISQESLSSSFREQLPFPHKDSLALKRFFVINF